MPATVATLHPTAEPAPDPWARLSSLPCELSVEVPLGRLAVGQILALVPGTVLGTRWPMRRDVPLRCQGVQLGYVEFEVSGDKLAVRVTRVS